MENNGECFYYVGEWMSFLSKRYIQKLLNTNNNSKNNYSRYESLMMPII